MNYIYIFSQNVSYEYPSYFIYCFGKISQKTLCKKQAWEYTLCNGEKITLTFFIIQYLITKVNKDSTEIC